MIQPIRNQVLVRPCASDDLSAGGIVVPDYFKERSAKAEIIAVGKGTKDKPMRIPSGVTCWHIKDAGVEIIEKGETLFLIEDRAVLGYLPN